MWHFGVNPTLALSYGNVETKGILKIDIHMLEHQIIIFNSVKIVARMVPNEERKSPLQHRLSFLCEMSLSHIQRRTPP